MDMGIKGKVALVAASSMGLGRAAAEALAQEGVNVALCARDQERLLRTVGEIHDSTGVKVIGVQADVSVSDDLVHLVDEVNRQLGSVDILVNNAGGPPYSHSFMISDDDWRMALELNLMSAVRLSRLVLPDMRKNLWGRIINITSIAAKEPREGMMLSNSVRAAVHGFAKTLANEVAPFGITVNSVLPGSTRTYRIESLAAAQAKEKGISLDEATSIYTRVIPVGRLGKPEEFGSLVAYLASQQAAFITGTSIAVDGGTIQSIF
jgi:3-oxoacyl-[acyl-carrier protein] reductase